MYVYSDGVVRDTTTAGGYRYATLEEAIEDKAREDVQPTVNGTYEKRHKRWGDLLDISQEE